MSPTVYSPPVPTYTALATTTLSGTASSVTFSSIPATYRDLVLVIDRAINTFGNGYALRYQLNGDTGTNYNSLNAFGVGSGSGTSDTYSSVNYGFIGFTYLSDVTNAIINFQDAGATDKHKTAVSRASNAARRVEMAASRWGNTARITSITLLNESGVSFGIGTTFSLYGIEA